MRLPWCFDSHPLQTGLGYRIDPGRVATGQQARLEMDAGFKNPIYCYRPR
jgi:hypothetical protein